MPCSMRWCNTSSHGLVKILKRFRENYLWWNLGQVIHGRLSQNIGTDFPQVPNGRCWKESNLSLKIAASGSELKFPLNLHEPVPWPDPSKNEDILEFPKSLGPRIFSFILWSCLHSFHLSQIFCLKDKVIHFHLRSVICHKDKTLPPFFIASLTFWWECPHVYRFWIASCLPFLTCGWLKPRNWVTPFPFVEHDLEKFVPNSRWLGQRFVPKSNTNETWGGIASGV